jgi:hypothetical protein
VRGVAAHPSGDLRCSTPAVLALALGTDLKGKASPLLYVIGIGLAFVDARFAEAVHVVVALIWLVPDRRIERAVHQPERR